MTTPAEQQLFISKLKVANEKLAAARSYDTFIGKLKLARKKDEDEGKIPGWLKGLAAGGALAGGGLLAYQNRDAIADYFGGGAPAIDKQGPTAAPSPQASDAASQGASSEPELSPAEQYVNDLSQPSMPYDVDYSGNQGQGVPPMLAPPTPSESFDYGAMLDRATLPTGSP